MPTDPDPITPLPTAPSRDRPRLFRDEANAFVAALPKFGEEVEAAAEATYDNAVEAAASAAAAAASAVAAEDAAAEVQLIDDEEFQITDSAGRLIARVQADGVLRLLGLSALTIESPQVNAGSVELTDGPVWTVDAEAIETIVDDVGRAVRRVDADGLHRVVALSAKRLTADESVTFETAYVRQPLFRTEGDRRPVQPLAEVVHILYYGQSWSLGFDASPAATTTQLYDSLMFNAVPGVAGTGICQQYSVADNAGALQSFVPAVEAGGTGKPPEFPAAYLGETGAVAMCDQIKAMIEFENNLEYTDHACQLLVSAPGEGSKSLEDLADSGLDYLQRLKEQIDRGFALAQAGGKTYMVGAVTWLQGSGVTPSTYAAQLEAMRADIDSHAKSVTGQAQDVKLIVWQQYPASNTPTAQESAKGVYDRFVAAADTYPHIVCAGPGYQWPQQSSVNIHYTSAGQIGLGKAFGQAIKRTIVDGVKFQPLRPLSIRRQGKVITIRFNVTAGSLVADTTQVVTIGNLGFNLYSSGGSLLTLSAAEITGPDTIKLTAASSVPSGAILGYADIGTDATDANKWRGNVRDDAGDFGGDHRWLVAFRLPLDN